MKKANELFDKINETLEGDRYYTQSEIAENRQLFISSIERKDTEYLDEYISLFDEEIQEELEIINNIKSLLA